MNIKESKDQAPTFFCWWEDTNETFTEEQLKSFFEKGGQGYEFNIESNSENSEVLGWIINGDPHSYFNNLKEVINFLNEENDINLVGFCDNMRIRRVL
jgi:vacuolar-type H+-ATPase subunit C/Vma6